VLARGDKGERRPREVRGERGGAASSRSESADKG